jgi:class 3 adenylate cyclase
MQVVTILFADVADSSSTKRNPALGRDNKERDSAYHVKIQTPYEELVRQCCCNRAGKVVKTMGDGFFLAFDNTFEAVRCAIDIQKNLASSPIETPVGSLRLRIGLHSGDPVSIADDFHGTDVDTAARVQAIASPDQILISPRTYELVRHMSDTTFHPHGEFAPKGVPRMNIWEVDWDDHGPRPTAIPSERDRRKGILGVAAVVILGLLLVGGGAGMFWLRSHQYHPPSHEVQRWYDDGVAALCAPAGNLLFHGRSVRVRSRLCFRQPQNYNEITVSVVRDIWPPNGRHIDTQFRHLSAEENQGSLG